MTRDAQIGAALAALFVLPFPLERLIPLGALRRPLVARLVINLAVSAASLGRPPRLA